MQKIAAEPQSDTGCLLALDILRLHFRWCFLIFIIRFHKISNFIYFSIDFTTIDFLGGSV